MAYEHARHSSRNLYGKLLFFYPKPYRDRFRESMEQTFSDLCDERRDAGAGLFGFVLWAFAETSIGIIKERTRMTLTRRRLGLSAIAGFLVTLPFMTLEWATRSDAPRSDFSILMFGIMWLFAGVFVLMLAQVVRTMREGNMPIARTAYLVLRVAFLGLIAWSWVGLVIDQMPCYLGASGC